MRYACLLLVGVILNARAEGPGREIRRGGNVAERAPGCQLRVVSWNIERGEKLERVVVALEQLRPDLALLQEVDLNARRSGRADVAAVLGRRLGLNSLFAPEFEELGQGRGALHGQAVLTRWPVVEARIIPFQDQSGHWEPRWWMPNWSVRRRGGRLALVVEFERLAVYDVHLESRGDEEFRRRQMGEVITDARRYEGRKGVVVAGDFNTRVADPPAVAELTTAGFRKAAGGEVSTTHGTALDWIFVRGALQSSNGTIHRDVRASDHYPVTVILKDLECR
jgi:endonuclease/exonuclease/phosphatase family metal-dependent hydrolase